MRQSAEQLGSAVRTDASVDTASTAAGCVSVGGGSGGGAAVIPRQATVRQSAEQLGSAVRTDATVDMSAPTPVSTPHRLLLQSATLASVEEAAAVGL